MRLSLAGLAAKAEPAAQAITATKIRMVQGEKTARVRGGKAELYEFISDTLGMDGF
jgi:hypothetical protein